jgi:heme iron utilization protein
MAQDADIYRVPDERALVELGALIRDHRQAALATITGRSPYLAMTAYVSEANFAGFLVHLSDLAAHKGHLRANPHCSLMIFEPDDGRREILQHKRASLVCTAQFVAKSTSEYATAQQHYLAALPMHRLMFELPDFDLVRLVPRRGVLNAGFGRAYRLTPDDLAAAAHR